MHATRALLLAATCLVPVVLPLSAEAQPQRNQPRRAAPAAQPAGEVIRDVQVRGNQRIETSTIRSYMLLQPGDRFDGDRQDRSLRTLFATGLFRDVQIGREGDSVVVTVQENPIVNQVVYEGNRKISDDNLRAETQLRARSVYTDAAAQADRTRLLELYARRGRFATRIEPKVIDRGNDRVDVVFEITEGDTALISRINFVGNDTFSDSRLKEVVTSREQAWYRPFSSSDTYEPERLNFDRELIRRYYQRNGFADIEVTNATAELAPDRSGFFVTYTIKEGPRYRVDSVEVNSTLRNVTAAQLRDQVEPNSGDWYNGDAVERTVQALSDSANLQGAPFVQVTERVTRNAEAGTVDIVFDVEEGPRSYVERIDITGNTRTQDRVIRRELRLAEGDAFNAAQVERSRQRIRDLGYFSPDVQITSTPGSQPDQVVLNTAVTERATGELTLGGGYSTDAGALADVGLRERNLLGTGIDARINSTIAQRRSQVDLSVTDPSFLDRNLAVGADLFYVVRDQREYSGYEERRVGGAIRAGYEFNERLRQSWAYTLSRRNVFNIDPLVSRFIREQAGVTWLSQVGQTLTYDTRDSRLDPRSGYVIRLGTDLAGLGGDVAFVRARLDGNYFIPFERWLGDPDYVLSISAGAGIIKSYADKPERIVDRFFLGGDNLRGFAVAGAGPRDLSLGTNDSLGGTKIWTQSTEMRFPLPLPSEIGLLGRAFVDVGSLSGVDGGPGVRDDSSPRVGVGVGISWRSPFGLINIDLAQAVVKKSYDETQVFRFGFGTRF
ncbi:outer membrane protein assembly factor BamA [Roseomonas marmotae]|uniref:Outer membrane protein assembly factor BamA n=1 Tax=Roseomonas marmotae TaxID=2768161 RepID=A0ABS3KBB8_9PROT|nr:outer membrane protein assembly factor BamA [Roseomonas marmotae]MBO1074282.1 outer membrane protein assembly factor BamA [Roseomonas marmotae]QTI78036.1 outer membrane protein assembly factor BamA [Roseomonas marmotae]